MAGTVLADTVVFARSFDQQQWAHAFGLQLTPARVPKPQQDSYTLHEWWFGTQPPTENNFAIVKGNVEQLMTGIHLAGPKLTPETFREGLTTRRRQDPLGLAPSSPTGSWLWRADGRSRQRGHLYWDGQRARTRLGRRQGCTGSRRGRGTPRQVAHRTREAVRSAGTVTIYEAGQIPDELKPADIPVPADAPANK
jgi:hypothetical protein